MSDLIDKAKNTIENIGKNVKDATNETIHRTAAEGEKARREVDGDSMTPSEKLASVADEAKQRVEAGVDHAKQAIRKNT
jgi:hypothetical protein